jgi:hypothetical protein
LLKCTWNTLNTKSARDPKAAKMTSGDSIDEEEGTGETTAGKETEIEGINETGAKDPEKIEETIAKKTSEKDQSRETLPWKESS